MTRASAAALPGLIEGRRSLRTLIGTDRAVWSSDAPEAFWVMGYPSNTAELWADLRAESFL